ncbi:MAG: tRNA (adenosine(37)-N6)-threonylcarbamoyltransferase complex transferase subunit TsaD [Patescibacteria group bacterium]
MPLNIMNILAIETSCDETAIAILECDGNEQSAEFNVLGNTLLSQVEIHKEYGGVFPALAKREHAKNLVPILEAALEEAELLHEDTQIIPEETRAKISEILAREPGLAEAFFEFVSECEPPMIDAIAVTAGPGLEPALWVGINFARALALLWDKPLVAVNHMEGHILAALASERSDLNASSQGRTLEIQNVHLPVLALLISGGHTELVLMKKWLKYELIGQTRDDAVGEAFDKVARMLELPYPGGPEISRLAESARSNLNASSQGSTLEFKLPRPMIDSGTCDFSFAGLKTAVLYLLKDKSDLNDEEKKYLAHEFENAVADVLWKKTAQALEEANAETLVIGGGVSANTHIRRVFTENMKNEFPRAALRIPVAALTTDNAIMIALAGYYRALRKEFVTSITANGNLSLAKKP